jgi:hypothetical protein
MRKITWALCALTISALFATEAAFFLGDWSPWKRYAALFWIFASAIIVLLAWASAFTPFLERDFRILPNRAWYVTAFILPPILILVNAGGTYFTSIDSEGLVQLASGMDLMHRDPSLGVFSIAYSRYLDRQYILNSLPSCLFGPSLWAARVGNSMFYIGAYLFFLSAVATYLRSKKKDSPLLFASFCGVMIAFGQYTLLNARKFEQTTMPIGVTLFFLAALVLFLAEPGPLRLLWLTWAFGFFPECYTPALGGWVLALAILLYLIFWRRNMLLIPTVIYGFVCLYIAYRVMKKTDPGELAAKLTFKVGHVTATDWTFRYLHGIRTVIGSDFTLIPAPLALAIIAAVFLSWRFREYRYAAVCAWAAAISCASVTLVGSNLNFTFYDMQRAMIIIPPLALGAVLLLVRYVSSTPDAQAAAGAVRFLMKVSMVYMVFTGVFTVFLVRSFFGITVLNDEDEVLAKINELVNSPTAVFPARIYIVPPLACDPGPGLRYFAPGAKLVFARPPAGERIPGAYVFSYISGNPADRFDDEIVPSRHPRPFIRMEKE